MRQVLEIMEMLGVDEKKQRAILFKVCDSMKKIDFAKSPFENTGIPHGTLARSLRNPDPYAGVKADMNEKAKKILEGVEKNEKNTASLHALTLLSAVGNIMDYGPDVRKDKNHIEYMLEHSRIAGNGFRLFEQKLGMRRLKIAFLSDNAGEVFFDRPLVQTLATRGHAVTYFVKEKPWINDAMRTDAIYAGIDKFAEIDFIPVRKWNLYLRAGNFLAKLKNYEMVIAKGQGNYETLGDVLDAFYLLIAKCPLVACSLGVRLGDIVFTRRRNR